ncbi:hypothetical protein D3C76_1285930 [compost metagenome]
MAVVEAAGQQQGLVEELANLCGQGERAPGAGMAACAGGDGDQAIDTGFGGFLGMAAGGDIVEHQAAVAMHGIDHFLHRAEAGDDDRHAVFHAQRQVGLQARVGRVDDQVDGIGRWRLQLRQACLDFLQPGLEAGAVALVQGREAADHAAGAAGQYQPGVGDQEHRCGNHGQAQALFEGGR